MPFKVVFKQGEAVLVEWEVNSQQDGEQQIIKRMTRTTDRGAERTDTATVVQFNRATLIVSPRALGEMSLGGGLREGYPWKLAN